MDVSLSPLSIHYLPSSEMFIEYIKKGAAYGMIPDLQLSDYIKTGRFINLAPDHSINLKLYWHCWNLKSKQLIDFTDCLINKNKEFLIQDNN